MRSIKRFWTARAFRPDLIWAEKQEYLKLETIGAVRRLGARLVHFTPDPYFSCNGSGLCVMDEAMNAFDILVYCKVYERMDNTRFGKPLIYMPLGYCDAVHRPLLSDDLRWKSGVGFLGGWEPRREHVLHVLAAAGMDLKIWGGYWEFLRDGRWTPRRQFHSETACRQRQISDSPRRSSCARMARVERYMLTTMRAH